MDIDKMQGVKWSLTGVPCRVVRRSSTTRICPSSHRLLHPSSPVNSPTFFHSYSPSPSSKPPHQQSQKFLTEVQNMRHGVWSPRPCILCASSVSFRKWKIQWRLYSVGTSSDLEDDDYMSDSDFNVNSNGQPKILNKDQFNQLRVILYPSSSDPIIKAMNEANSVQEVFDIVERCGDQLTAEQASQAVVTLWDLQKVYGRFGFDRDNIHGSMLIEFLEKIVSHPVFKKLITSLDRLCENLDSTAVSSPYTSPKLKNYFEGMVAEHLDRKDLHDYIVILFKTLRYIKTSNFRLCNAFWLKSMKAVELEIKKQPIHFLGLKDMMRRNLYHRYMYFNNNLGGSYRNYPFENTMSKLLLKDIRMATGLVPSKLAYMTSFLLSYSPKEGLPEDVIERVLLCGPQFSIFDSLVLSRGIQISLALNSFLKRRKMQQITALCRMLDSSCEQHLKTVNSLVDMTHILRAYVSRGGSPRAFLFERILAAHLPFLSQLNSRHIKDLCFCLINARYLSPEILNSITQYITEHKDYIHVETSELVLSCLYKLGHHPPESERFFLACTSTFSEDGPQMTSLSILQMCLSLNKFGHLPSKIIHHVFNLSFIDQLDEELSKCSSKSSYPMQVRHLLMELNRAVCLDHPEENIPWFHEKYCKELLESVAVPSSVFLTEVHQALVQLVGDPQVLRANVHTPYYYFLDFEFLLDAESRPVPVREYVSGHNTAPHSHLPETQPGFRRVAVLVRNEEDYCVNGRQLLGRHQMERRHLELLGYEVVEVPHFHWYSMSLSTFTERLNYLKRLIYPTQT
ncbi:hypothetical protein Pmani_000921 [Petrolisthes manimaculis]|uniref:RAP domain-containing protein n=1 Tax=Petrolisthes manimaculis TaxID=1843537 RepID=A0AAE1QKP2_9EUCA|nr:hypothetical protein Pmani_000921 [Petrolisthes manimaculis]